jgi:hypothetical protein
MNLTYFKVADIVLRWVLAVERRGALWGEVE